MSEAMKYPVILTPDTNNTLLVTFPDFEEAVTFGDDENDALFHAQNALMEVIAARIAAREPIPQPSDKGDAFVNLPVVTMAKLLIYWEMGKQHLKKADLARKLDCNQKQIDRLLDVKHNSTIGQISAAFAALGKTMVIGVENRDHG